MTAYGVRVFRIKALEDLPLHGVRKGERGGWVSSATTSRGKPRLSGQAWLGGEAVLIDDARVSNTAIVSGHAVVRGSARIRGHARVFGQARISGKAEVSGHAQVCGDASVSERACVTGHAHISDSATIAGRVIVAGMARVFGQASVSEKARVLGRSELGDMAMVSGRARLEDVETRGEVHICENAYVFGGAQIPPLGCVGGSACIGDSSHCLMVSPFGPKGETLMVLRQQDSSAEITLGYWRFTGWKQFKREVLSWENQHRWKPWLKVIRGVTKAWADTSVSPPMGLSYELTNLRKTVGLCPEVLFRIRATRDIPEQGVHQGDLGGWVQSAFTSSGEPRISGTAWLHDNAELRSDALIKENARVAGHVILDDSVIVDGNARIGDAAEIVGRCRVTGNAIIQDNACLADDVFVCGEAFVGGNAWLSGSISLFDNAKVTSNSVIRGDAWIAKGAEITEADHVKSFENIGPGRNVTLYRSDDGNLRIVEDEWELQSWSITDFEKEIARRNWDDPVWLAEYRNVLRIAQLLSGRWA